MGDRRPRSERVAELVDSPDFRQRRRNGNNLSARFVGSVGLYRVHWNTRTRVGRCSCPADLMCKHLEALQLTWQKRPESFLEEGAPNLRNEFERHDARMQKAVNNSLEKFRVGHFPSMVDAALEAAEELDLDGDYETGETGELMFLLDELAPDGNVNDWTDPEEEPGPEMTEDEVLQEQENFRKMRGLNSIAKAIRSSVEQSRKSAPRPVAKRATQEEKRNLAQLELANQAAALEIEWLDSDGPGTVEYWERVEAVLKEGRKLGVLEED